MKKEENAVNKIICGDALETLKSFDDNLVDLVLTDPPYFLDKMDDKWSYDVVNNKKNQQTIKSLPAGMKMDREQGKSFYEEYIKIAKEAFRVIKPGGFFFSFSSPRLYHRMASAVDDAAEFLIRDCFIWLYTQNQAKAMSLNHVIDKMDTSDAAKKRLKEKLKGWKTPQIKSCFEPIVMAQKPPEGTFVDNIIKHNVGLFDTNIKIGDNMFPSNVFTVNEINEIIDKAFLISKPTKKEKGDYNTHQTVKPLAICEYIIHLSTFSPDAIVLDPFLGSGTTAVAAKKLGKNYIGIDSNPEYVKIAEKRLQELDGRRSQNEAEVEKYASQLNIFNLARLDYLKS